MRVRLRRLYMCDITSLRGRHTCSCVATFLDMVKNALMASLPHPTNISTTKGMHNHLRAHDSLFLEWLVFYAYVFSLLLMKRGGFILQFTSLYYSNGTVKGLFVWCQVCGHGGHLKHIRDWHKMETRCPAGCGHECFTQPAALWPCTPSTLCYMYILDNVSTNPHATHWCDTFVFWILKVLYVLLILHANWICQVVPSMHYS